MRKGLLSILTVNVKSAEHYYEILLAAYAFLHLYLGFCSFNAANKEFQTFNLLLSCFYLIEVIILENFSNIQVVKIVLLALGPSIKCSMYVPEL